MKLIIEKLRLPLLCLAVALMALSASCGSSTVQPPHSTETTPQAAQTTQPTEPAPLSADSTLPAAELQPAETPAPATGQPSSEALVAAHSQEAPAAAAPDAFTRKVAIGQGHAVLSGKRSIPSHNAQELVGFYEDYKAERDAAVSIYSFRTQDENEPLYTLYTLSVEGGVTKMIEDTTHYYDAQRFPEQTEAPGVTVLGNFTMTKNKYGFLTVDVEGESGLLQYQYQVTGYDELYPSIQKHEEEYQQYLAPLSGTGILELTWEDSTQLLDVGVFPEAFESIAGAELPSGHDPYWDEEKKTYSFPQELVEGVLTQRFGLTEEPLRGLSAYDGDSAAYNYVPHSNSGLTELRILKVTEPEEGTSAYTPGTDEGLLEIRYEFYSPENGAPEKRGKLTVLLTAEDGFRYLGNELLTTPGKEETAE